MQPSVSTAAQRYLGQICRADLPSPWGWTPVEPLYRIEAGHILVAGVLIALHYELPLLDDQLLALRWERSATCDCYLPADLINHWVVLVGHHMRQAQADPTQYPHPTIDLSLAPLPLELTR